MRVVLDTNILVSALWSRGGSPARVIVLLLNGLLTPCHDHRIMAEYREVLHRSKFGFLEWEISNLLAQIENNGLSVVPLPVDLTWVDDDRKFYEVAKYCSAKLITGNRKHFPSDDLVISAEGFLSLFQLGS